MLKKHFNKQIDKNQVNFIKTTQGNSDGVLDGRDRT
jgi:hypothetical protein